MMDKIINDESRRFPRVRITPARANVRPIFNRLAVGFLAPIALIIAVVRTPSIAIGGLLTIAVLIVLVGVIFFVTTKAQNQRAASSMRDMPAGGFFKGRATLLSRSGDGVVYGRILLTGAEILFTPDQQHIEQICAEWSLITEIQVAPLMGKIGRAILTFSFSDGRELVFRLRSYKIFVLALSKHLGDFPLRSV